MSKGDIKLTEKGISFIYRACCVAQYLKIIFLILHLQIDKKCGGVAWFNGLATPRVSSSDHEQGIFCEFYSLSL